MLGQVGWQLPGARCNALRRIGRVSTALMSLGYSGSPSCRLYFTRRSVSSSLTSDFMDE
jgi:hypothetical protein